MAKKRVSTSKNPASTASPPTSSRTSTQGGMVLRVRTSERMKELAEKLSEPISGKKLKTISKKKSSKIDALKPKKPPTAFFFFLEDFRKDFQETNPDIKSMRDIGKACGDKWKTMTYEEKVHYYDIATEKRAEFDQAMAEYNKRKEMGDFQEYEDDSDFYS
ncbi:OLC1v1022148C1 [Oldenlandia corymbosa var. corymbosa]|uniref:OLC1v1022148C1 n=1 Tax=Oldenlandia corymbosa var. corymbosa TaxID=529605 RepID=A0AAV1BX77_OLDCO|nr:OLC1v1022148C1 [Oldenlandia corymbosa var. corymbosa]